MVETNSELLSCVLIPVKDQTLLLPNVSIAEIVDYADISPDTGDRDWLLGHFGWRGLYLPVLSWEAANGGSPIEPDAQRGRILVLNTVTDAHKKIPFIALATQGIPRQAKITATELKKQDRKNASAELMSVDFEGEEVQIPNLEVLEGLALKASKKK